MYCDSTTVRYGVIHGHTPTDWIVQLCMFPYNHLSTGAFPTSAHVNLLMSWWAMRLPMRHWVSIQNGSTAPVAFSSRESPFRMNKLKTFEHRTVYIYIYTMCIYIYIHMKGLKMQSSFGTLWALSATGLKQSKTNTNPTIQVILSISSDSSVFQAISRPDRWDVPRTANQRCFRRLRAVLLASASAEPFWLATVPCWHRAETAGNPSALPCVCYAPAGTARVNQLVTGEPKVKCIHIQYMYPLVN